MVFRPVFEKGFSDSIRIDLVKCWPLSGIGCIGLLRRNEMLPGCFKAGLTAKSVGRGNESNRAGRVVKRGLPSRAGGGVLTSTRPSVLVGTVWTPRGARVR